MQFSLTCSVTVDMNTIVDIDWVIPNKEAEKQHRIYLPLKTAQNLTMMEANLKIEQQVKILGLILTLRKAIW